MSKPYYIERSSDPFADTLAMFGLAEVLRQIAGNSGYSDVDVLLEDCGSAYRLTPTIDIEALIGQTNFFLPVKFLNAADVPKDVPEQLIINFPELKRERDEFLDALAAHSSVQPTSLSVESIPELPADALDWNVLRAFHSPIPADITSHNKPLSIWWQVRDHFPEVLTILLGMVSDCPNHVVQAESSWKSLQKQHGLILETKITAGQLHSPTMGEGQNSSKSNRFRFPRGKSLEVFWLIRFLYTVGFYRGAFSYDIWNYEASKSEGRKSYTIVPQSTNYVAHGTILERFRSLLHPSARTENVSHKQVITFEILALLRYTSVLLDFYQPTDEDLPGPIEDMWGENVFRVGDLIRGFASVHYKSLGRSDTPINMAFLELPQWMKISDESELTASRAVLEEHEKIMRQFLLWEEESGIADLLQKYRNFLSGDDIDAFFSFTTAYAGFLIGRRERNQNARQFTTKGIERLLMNAPSYYEITQDEGFKQITYAIRNSTVVPQFRKALYKLGKVKEGPLYDIRYGLHHELSRTGRRTEDFINALTEFLTKYNAETTQVFETQGKKYRDPVNLSAIEHILWLIDQYKSSQLICNLLIACGYAYDDSDDDKAQKS